MTQSISLDASDLRILKELQHNARITNQDLAAKIFLSPSSCLQRVRRLERNNILLSCYARINLPLICRYVLCVATVSFKKHTQQDFRAFEKLVAEMPEVIECFTVSGEFDFFLKILCPDMNRYLEINEILLNSSDYAVSINTHVVMNQNKNFNGVDLDSLFENRERRA